MTSELKDSDIPLTPLGRLFHDAVRVNLALSDIAPPSPEEVYAVLGDDAALF